MASPAPSSVWMPQSRWLEVTPALSSAAGVIAHWRELEAATRQREYSPSSAVGGNIAPFLAAYAQRSAAARAQLPQGGLNLRYGPQPAQALDFWLPAAPRSTAAKPPLLVFIHGGYWQQLSKNESAFAAPGCVAQGWAHASLDYTLAPQASVAQIVVECRQAIAWLYAHADDLGFDAQRIVVAGSSAGAHLSAMCGVGGDFDGTPSVQSRIKALVLMSGVFDVQPLVGTTINAALGLDQAAARHISPALHDLRGFPTSIACWGEIEPAQFRRQSEDFATGLGLAGSVCQTLKVSGRNHFDMVFDLADPSTPLGAAVTNLMHSI